MRWNPREDFGFCRPPVSCLDSDEKFKKWSSSELEFLIKVFILKKYSYIYESVKDEFLNLCFIFSRERSPLERCVPRFDSYRNVFFCEPHTHKLCFLTGIFPQEHTKKIITFPCDQHRTKEELDYIISTVKNFYSWKVILSLMLIYSLNGNWKEKLF